MSRHREGSLREGPQSVREASGHGPWWDQELGAHLWKMLGDRMHLRRFGKGECLWREGESPGLLVAIRKGRVKTFRQLPTGGTVTVFIFTPGDVFGLLPLLDGGPYPGSAVAMEPVEAEVMPRSAFHRLLDCEPELAFQVVALLGHRLRQAFDVIRSVSTPGATSRVAAALLALVPEDRLGSAPPRIRLPATAQEFAGALGIAPETLSRAISTLAKEKIVRRLRPGRFEILDPGALERAARTPLG
ncbi:MAG: Crp/Fnr family transcriptional regulator [Gemmatimonadetes bacterium]|nr:Crp/Fnr family transcriptional regulator [Gemmatimonadota bacterium]